MNQIRLQKQLFTQGLKYHVFNTHYYISLFLAYTSLLLAQCLAYSRDLISIYRMNGQRLVAYSV